MCGILGLLALQGASPSLDDAAVIRLRDTMVSRGPDAAGLWRFENAVLAHRRLSVVDRSESADQPMSSPDGRYVIVYNGELYNDAELRRELGQLGLPRGGWRTGCDTETVLAAFEAWGDAAFERLRGMFAVAVYDSVRRRVVLARDPLGMKPLYFWFDPNELVFASQLPTVLGHPKVPKVPNLRMISAYLSTIRTVLGIDTLFEGVYALEPGRALSCDLRSKVIEPEIWTFADSTPVRSDPLSLEEAAEELVVGLRDSIKRHMRADVPVCTLLSGGLDSALVAALARDEAHELRSYCVGADGSEQELSQTDLGYGARTAAALELPHTEARLRREDFLEEWRWMVDELGVPLSTPNEVAIHRVAARLRRDDCIVTLSGEGADELLAGYEGPMDALYRLCADRPTDGRGGEFQLATTSWISPMDKGELFSAFAWDALEGDRFLLTEYERIFDQCVAEAGPHATAIDAHARFLRRVNLSGLLQRLDTSTMLASVEGRTPFADIELMRLSESFPMSVKYEPVASLVAAGGGGTEVVRAPRTKRCLREAARGLVPEEVRTRAKASFPLPFQSWLEDEGGRLLESPFARALFQQPTLEAVAAEPSRHWNYAWPMLNLACWGDRWFS
jgi:asparagine synthase (glutamine-hydrolysing)